MKVPALPLSTPYLSDRTQKPFGLVNPTINDADGRHECSPQHAKMLLQMMGKEDSHTRILWLSEILLARKVVCIGKLNKRSGRVERKVIKRIVVKHPLWR